MHKLPGVPAHALYWPQGWWHSDGACGAAKESGRRHSATRPPSARSAGCGPTGQLQPAPCTAAGGLTIQAEGAGHQDPGHRAAGSCVCCAVLQSGAALGDALFALRRLQAVRQQLAAVHHGQLALGSGHCLPSCHLQQTRAQQQNPCSSSLCSALRRTKPSTRPTEAGRWWASPAGAHHNGAGVRLGKGRVDSHPPHKRKRHLRPSRVWCRCLRCGSGASWHWRPWRTIAHVCAAERGTAAGGALQRAAALWRGGCQHAQRALLPVQALPAADGCADCVGDVAAGAAVAGRAHIQALREADLGLCAVGVQDTPTAEHCVSQAARTAACTREHRSHPEYTGSRQPVPAVVLRRATWMASNKSWADRVGAGAAACRGSCRSAGSGPCELRRRQPAPKVLLSLEQARKRSCASTRV